MLLEVEKTSRILWYYLFTYGLAFLIVTISIAIDPFVYTRADYCVWMEQTNVFWSTFITPIIVFIVVSIVFQLSSCCFLFILSIRHPITRMSDSLSARCQWIKANKAPFLANGGGPFNYPLTFLNNFNGYSLIFDQINTKQQWKTLSIPFCAQPNTTNILLF